MNIHEIVRAVDCLNDVLSLYEKNPAIRMCVLAHFQGELIQREIVRDVKEPERRLLHGANTL